MEWLRLWHDMPTDPKFKTIARHSGEPISLVIAVYMHLLVDASRNVTRGHISVTHEDLASALDVTESQIQSILGSMESRVLNAGYLSGWEKRQPKREDSGNPETGAKSAAQRKAEQRERERLARLSAETPAQKSPCHDESRNVTTEEIRLEEIRKEKRGSAPEAPLVDNSQPKASAARLSLDFEFPDTWSHWARTARADIPEPESIFRKFKTLHADSGSKTPEGWLAAFRSFYLNERVDKPAINPQDPLSDPQSRASIEAMGVAKGLGKWDEVSEQFPSYRARVLAAPTRTVKSTWTPPIPTNGAVNVAK